MFVLTFQFNPATNLPEVTLTDGTDTVSAHMNPLDFPIDSEQIEEVDCAMRYRLQQVKHATA